MAARDVGTPAADTYVCSVTDRGFVNAAKVNLPAFSTWRDDYAAGGVDHATFAAIARETRTLIERPEPRDRSLGQARLLIGAMLSEYDKGAMERAAGGLGAKPLLHAQQLSGSVRGHLAEISAGLSAVGCDISPLFAA